MQQSLITIVYIEASSSNRKTPPKAVVALPFTAG